MRISDWSSDVCSSDLLVVTMGLAMIAPAIADASAGHRDWMTFAVGAGCAVFVGGLMIMGSMGSPIELALRQGFALTTLSGVALSAVGALPLVFAGLGLSYADAFFEVVSGLTTTGSTVLVGLDNLPPGILLWRAMLQWGERQRVVVGKSVSVRVDPGGRR